MRARRRSLTTSGELHGLYGAIEAALEGAAGLGGRERDRDFPARDTPAGALVIVVCGGVASTVNDALAGVGSTSPAALIARTWKVWAPSASELYCCGLVHEAHGAPSRLHWKVSFVSLPWNVNVTEDCPMIPDWSAVDNSVRGTRRWGVEDATRRLVRGRGGFRACRP